MLQIALKAGAPANVILEFVRDFKANCDLLVTFGLESSVAERRWIFSVPTCPQARRCRNCADTGRFGEMAERPRSLAVL